MNLRTKISAYNLIPPVQAIFAFGQCWQAVAFINFLMGFILSELLCFINVGVNSEKLKTDGGMVAIVKIMCICQRYSHVRVVTC